MYYKLHNYVLVIFPILFSEKLKIPQNFGQKWQKFWNFKLWKKAKSTVFNFFQIFFLLNDRSTILYSLQKTEFIYLLNITKTAENAEFAEKPRISRECQGESRFWPRIRIQRPRITLKSFLKMLALKMDFILSHSVIETHLLF